MGIHLGIAVVVTIACTGLLTNLVYIHQDKQTASLLDVLLPFFEISVGFFVGWLWNLMVADSFKDSDLMIWWAYTIGITAGSCFLIYKLNNRQNKATKPKTTMLRKLQLQLATNGAAVLLGWAWYGATQRIFVAELTPSGATDEGALEAEPESVREEHCAVLLAVYIVAVALLIRGSAPLTGAHSPQRRTGSNKYAAML